MKYKKNYTHSPTALKFFKATIIKNKILLKADSNFVFVCGARPNHAFPNARDRLIEYAEKHIKNSHFFIAERFFEVFTNSNNKDLLSLEDKLAEYSDCIIIILESESTFAELGAFSIKDELAEMILAINDVQFQHATTPSFISLGPLAKINQSSKFKPVLYSNLQSILTAVPDIQKRLSVIVRKNRKGYNVQNYEDFTHLHPKVRMFFLHDVILLFNPITHSELISILIFILGGANYNIHVEIAMLKALKMICEEGVYLVNSPSSKDLYFHYSGINLLNLKSEIINHFHKYSQAHKNIIMKRI